MKKAIDNALNAPIINSDWTKACYINNYLSEECFNQESIGKALKDAIDELQIALQMKHYSTIQSKAHNLKNKYGYFGLEQSYMLTEVIELNSSKETKLLSKILLTLSDSLDTDIRQLLETFSTISDTQVIRELNKLTKYK